MKRIKTYKNVLFNLISWTRMRNVFFAKIQFYLKINAKIFALKISKTMEIIDVYNVPNPTVIYL